MATIKLLIIGSGGREHALAWKLSQSPKVGKIFFAPGNAGTGEIGTNVPLSPENVQGLLDFAKSRGIDFTVVGPDDALAAGIVNAFEDTGLRIFGPRAEAALLESSKIFAKEFMRRHGIPTAESREFTDSAEAQAWCREARYPLVVKADGLALGKGVVIANTLAEAAEAVSRAMDEGIFGEAGKRIVIEEFLQGVECSIHALVDSDSYILFPDCRDHKQAYDGNQGPNTGGMGTISPSMSLTDASLEQVRTEVLDRFVAGIKADGIPFKGMLFPGLMMTADGLRVLEFNCRWGDPETQVLVRRLRSDLLDLLEATVDGKLSEQTPEWEKRAAACVILASGGYPGAYEKGNAISGLGAASSCDDVVVFHAGTKKDGDSVVTNGGRVLGVTGLGETLSGALETAYAAADQIHFENLHRRNDIGASAIHP